MITVLIIWAVAFTIIGIYVGMTSRNEDSVIIRLIDIISGKNAFGKLQLLLGGIMLLPLMLGETIAKVGMYIGDILWELGEKISK